MRGSGKLRQRYVSQGQNTYGEAYDLINLSISLLIARAYPSGD